MVKKRLYSLGVKQPRLYHFTINFPPVQKITNSIRLDRDRKAKTCIRHIKRRFPKCNFIYVRDINKSNGMDRIHYHVALFGKTGVKNPGPLVARVIKSFSEALKTPLNSQLIGYKKKQKLYEYFAKRVSGLFEHKKNSQYLTYSRIAIIEEYARVFYCKQSLWTSINYSRPEGTEFITCKNPNRKKCPFCGHTGIYLTSDPTYKPPPPTLECPYCSIKQSEEVFVKQGSVFYTYEASPLFWSEDFNFTYACCKSCARQFNDINFQQSKEALKMGLHKVAADWDRKGREKNVLRIKHDCNKNSSRVKELLNTQLSKVEEGTKLNF